MKKLKVLLLTPIFLMTLFLTGCWDSHELNQLAFVIALGFDKSSSGITVTAQIINPRAIAAQKTTNEAPIIIDTVQGKSTLEALRRMSEDLPRRATGTHMQTVVFSEEFARDGISEVTDFLLRHYQTSPELYFTVAKDTTANNVLSKLTKLESSPSVKINSSLQISQKVWAAIKATRLTELVNCIASNEINPVLTGINLKNNTDDISLDDLKLTQNDPIQLKDNAVFINDKLVGWLNEEESRGYNYICGNVKSSVGYTESQEIGTITLDVTNATAKQKTIITNNKPVIKLDIQIVSKIENVSSNFDITKEENLRKVENLSEQKLKNMCLSSIEKAKSLKSDIFGFGEIIHRSNPKLWKSLKDSWNEEGFVNLPVEVNVKFNITGSDSISKSILSNEDQNQ